MKKVIKKIKGFTLVEVLIAMAIFALSSLVISGIFSNTYLAYKKVKKIQDDLGRMQLVINAMGKELRTSRVASSAEGSIMAYNYSSPSVSNCIWYYFISDGSGRYNLEVRTKAATSGETEELTIASCADPSGYLSGNAQILAKEIVAGNFKVVSYGEGATVGKATISVVLDNSIRVQTTISMRGKAISEI